MLRGTGVRVATAAATTIAALALLAPVAPAAQRPGGARGRILAIAASQIGYHDHGDYCTKYGPCEYWCSLFATWVWRRAGIPVPSLAFTGWMYTWSRAQAYVLHRPSLPRPGDAVLYGTGPSTVSSSRHVGIVEAAFPGYLVTIEGDVQHQVLRFVVPIAHPDRVGAPGPIYAYASPVPHGPPMLKVVGPPRGRGPAAKIGPLTRRRLAAIRSLRAFQHMPYRTADTTIDWVDVDRHGRIDVQVTSNRPLWVAQQEWEDFLARYDDAGTAYAVSFRVPGA